MTDTKLLRLREVAARLSLPRSTVYDLIKTRRFPKPLKPGERLALWREDEVTAWIEAHTQARRP
jgi:excisionase family DNA binding protein